MAGACETEAEARYLAEVCDADGHWLAWGKFQGTPLATIAEQVGWK